MGNDVIVSNLNADKAYAASWDISLPAGAFPAALTWTSGTAYDYFSTRPNDPHDMGALENWLIKRDADGSLLTVDFVATRLHISADRSTITALETEDPSQGDLVNAGSGDCGYHTGIRLVPWLSYPVLRTGNPMTTETKHQEELTQPCWRTRRASVPARLRARGLGACGMRPASHQHFGLHANFVATANGLRRSGTATRHVCGLGWVGEVQYQDGAVHSMRVVSTKWLGGRMDVGSAFATHRARAEQC